MLNLICTSLSDQKPFYMMFNVLKSLDWVKITKKIWSTNLKRYCDIPFYRLNIVNKYNCKMGQVDIGEQLRGSYQYDHCGLFGYGFCKCLRSIHISCIACIIVCTDMSPPPWLIINSSAKQHLPGLCLKSIFPRSLFDQTYHKHPHPHLQTEQDVSLPFSRPLLLLGSWSSPWRPYVSLKVI